MPCLARYFRRNFHQVRLSVTQGRSPYCVNVGAYLLVNNQGEAPPVLRSADHVPLRGGTPRLH